MVVEPRPPGRAQRIAGLQHPAQPRAGAAAHQAEMAAALLRHQFENDARLAVALDAEHDAFIGPLHGQMYVRWPSFRDAATGADPESIVTDRGYGFPVLALPAPNDTVYSLGNSSPISR